MDENGVLVVTIGTDWYLYAILSSIITFSLLFLFIKYYQFVPLYLLISEIITYLLFIVVYTRLTFLNPGFPDKIDINLVKKSKKHYMYCSLCNIWVSKRVRTKHCHKCGMCIEN